MTTLQKGEKTSFKGKYQKFQITLELNNAQVLGLQAFNLETKDVYSFALDKTYLLEHPQFFNLITEPKDILSYFIKNFNKVVFDGGKLIFPFTGPNCQKTEQINILLFKEPGLKAVYREIALQQQSIKKLQNQNGAQDCLIAELTKSFNRLSSDIQSLKSKDTQTSIEISGLKSKDISLSNDIQGFNKRVTPLQQSVALLNIKNKQYGDLLLKLQQKDKAFDLSLSLLDQRQKKISDQLVQSDRKIMASLQAVQSKYQSLCKLIGTLKIKDGEIEKQIKQLMTQEEEDKKFQVWISDKLKELRKEIHDNSTRFNLQIKNLQAKDTSIENKVDTEVTDIKNNFNKTLKDYEILFLSKIQKNSKDIETAQKDIAQLNVKFTKRDERFQIQIREFKAQEERISIYLLNADNKLNALLNDAREDYKKKFNYVKKEVQRLASQTDNKFMLFTTVAEKRFISIEKKDEQLSFEVTKTNKAIEKVYLTIQALRKQVDEKDNKIKEEIKKTNVNIKQNVENILFLINQLKVRSQKHQKQLGFLSVFVSNLNKQICALQDKIKGEVNALDIYYKSIHQFLQKLVFKDVAINKQIQDLSKREKSDSELTKKAIEDLKKEIAKLQSKDADYSKKIGQLQAKDKSIVCKIDSQVGRLDQTIDTKFQATQKSINTITSELSRVQTKLTNEIKGLNQQDVQIRNFINDNVENLKKLICEKASNEYVIAQFGNLNKKIGGLSKSLNQEVNARDTNDLQIRKIIQSNYIALLQKISVKADKANTVDNKNFQRIIKELRDTDTSILKQFNNFVSQTKCEIAEIKKRIKQNEGFAKFVNEKFTFKYINSLLSEPKLGNHPLNQNSKQIINTKRLADNILSVSKPQTKQGAYNFVNVYQIQPYSIMRYTVKITKCGMDIPAYISFSDQLCLTTEYYVYVAESLNSKKKVLNQQGRNGIRLAVNSGDQIQCIVNLFSNSATFNEAIIKQVRTFPINGNLKGKSLYLQVASEQSIEFEIII